MPSVLSKTFQLETSEFANSFTLPALFSFCMKTFWEQHIYTDIKYRPGLSKYRTVCWERHQRKTIGPHDPLCGKSRKNDGCPHKDPVTRKTFSCHEHCCFTITKVEYQSQTKRILYIFRGLKYSLCNFIRCRWLSSGIKFTENETCRI